jgi:hypothetical protein
MALLVSLITLPSALVAEGYNAPTYRTCYNAATDARLPGVVLGANGRWVYDPAQLPVIAASLGLTRANTCAAA